MALMQGLDTGDPITRDYLQTMLMKPLSAADAPVQGWYFTPEQQALRESNDAYARQMLSLLDQYGVNDLTQLPPEVRAQIPNQGVYVSNSPNTLGDLFVETVTHPGVMLLLGAGVVVASGAATAGVAATGYGAGGSGGASANVGSSARAGGAGTDGIVIVWEYK